MVQSSDIALTCLDYAGVEATPVVPFDTRSLRPLLENRGTAEDLDRGAVCGTGRPGWPTIRRRNFKYIEHALHADKGQRVLFDLDSDPGEQLNLVGESRYADIARDLAAELHAAVERPVLEIGSLG